MAVSITLRAATPTDAAALAGIYAPYALALGIASDGDPPTARSLRARMQADDGLYPWIVAATSDEESGGTIIGFAYAQAFHPRPSYRWTAETAIHVGGEDHIWGGDRLLYGALLATLREQGFTQAIAEIAVPNDALITLHEALGYRRAGIFREVSRRHGQWVDVGYWQRELTDSPNAPTAPRPFSEVGLVRD